MGRQNASGQLLSSNEVSSTRIGLHLVELVPKEVTWECSKHLVCSQDYVFSPKLEARLHNSLNITKSSWYLHTAPSVLHVGHTTKVEIYTPIPWSIMILCLQCTIGKWRYLVCCIDQEISNMNYGVFLEIKSIFDTAWVTKTWDYIARDLILLWNQIILL